MKRVTEGDAVKSLRVEAGLTQTELASILGQPQSFISKIEAGERTLHVSDLEPLAQALGCQITTILNRITGFDSVLDRWALSESELTELIDSNPSLRGMVLGYAAEVKFRRMFLNRADIKSTKDDDHNRKKKGDRRLLYKGEELVIEVKSLQTNMVKYDDNTGEWSGKSQVDGSDRRIVKFNDGTQLNTTLLLRGEFDILAVNCFAFDNTWRFVFALNRDLATSTYAKYSEEQRKNLIASLQRITWPPKAPFTDDFDDILERAWKLKETGPNGQSVEDS